MPDLQTFTRTISHDSAAVIGLTVSARDPHAAASKVYERLRTIEERASVGSGSGAGLVFSMAALDRTNQKLPAY